MAGGVDARMGRPRGIQTLEYEHRRKTQIRVCLTPVYVYEAAQNTDLYYSEEFTLHCLSI